MSDSTNSLGSDFHDPMPDYYAGYEESKRGWEQARRAAEADRNRQLTEQGVRKKVSRIFGKLSREG